MVYDFRGSNLKGHSFKGRDLTGFDFEGADIRGVDFSEANLTGANLSRTKAGLSTFGFSLVIVSILALTVFASLVTSYSTVSLLSPQSTDYIVFAVATVLRFGIITSVMRVVLKQGFSRQLGWCTLILITIPFVISTIATATAINDPLAFTLAFTIVSKINFQLFGLAGIIAGGFINCLAITVQVSVYNRAMFLATCILTGVVSFFGINYGLPQFTLISRTLEWIFSASLTLLVFAFSTFIGYRASQRDSKFEFIQATSISLLALQGTQFRCANLTDADFTTAQLSCSSFHAANLTRARWLNTQGLVYARIEGTYLENNAIRQLVVSGYGHGILFDHANLRGLNLQGAKLTDASFIGADLSYSNLRGADLSRAKLVQTQLHETQLSQACLTGAYIQDWGISLNTQFEQVECAYVYMHMPTPDDPDPCRKPDNRSDIFKPGDFADFITPIIKTLDLYNRQNVDPRLAAQAYKTIDLFHHEDIDPAAVALALSRLATQHPEAGLEVVALEGRGHDAVRLQARISSRADPSELSQKYFEQYGEIRELPDKDMQSMLTGLEAKDNHIRSLETMVATALQQSKFYVETLYNMGDIVTEKNSIQIEAGGDVSGVVVGDMSGVMNFGAISGNVTNSISQIPEATEEHEELKVLLSQLQTAIETENNLSSEDKSEALEQVKVLAEVAQKPEDTAMKKAAKTAIKVLKGTVTGLAETTNLVQECTKLLPAISSLLLVL